LDAEFILGDVHMVGSKPSKRDLQKSASLVRQLYGIAAEYEGGLDAQIQDLLELGCDIFDLEIGTVARIDGDLYEIVATVHPRGVELRAGDILKLVETYCSRTIEADGPFGIDSVSSSDMASHPAYQAHELEAYVGTPIRIDGDVYGTLSFSGTDRRRRSFDGVEFDCLQLMASWLGAELARRDVEDELDEANDELGRRTQPRRARGSQPGRVPARS
jgi:GAF domain-containing protein